MKKIIFITLGLGFICSTLICFLYTVLKPISDSSKQKDMIKNIVKVSSLQNRTDENIEELFNQNIETKYLDLKTLETFDLSYYKTHKDEKIYLKDSLISIPSIPRYIPIYLIKDKNTESYNEIIIPVYGKGLWSTMYGLVSIVGDNLDTISDILFYEHGETPGLGDEITKKSWTIKFKGKKPFDDSGEFNPVIEIVQNKISTEDPNIEHKIDGITGASFTSRGVENILRFWLGNNGVGPFLKKIRKKGNL